MSQNLLDEVREMAADVFAVDPQTLHADSSPERVDVWDSVQHLNLVLALEARYGIQFDPEEMDRMKNLGAIAELLKSKMRF
jgi:acyl carrier protein